MPWAQQDRLLWGINQTRPPYRVFEGGVCSGADSVAVFTLQSPSECIKGWTSPRLPATCIAMLSFGGGGDSGWNFGGLPLLATDESIRSELSKREKHRPRGAWQSTSSTRPSSRTLIPSVSGSCASSSESLSMTSSTRDKYDGGACEDARDYDRGT
jgi:hypothetical protein